MTYILINSVFLLPGLEIGKYLELRIQHNFEDIEKYLALVSLAASPLKFEEGAKI